MSKSKEEGAIKMEKQKKIFISHSSKDEEYVLEFVKLLEFMGISEEEIVCSSIPPYCVDSDVNLYQWLAEQFQNYDLYVFYMLSHNYYSSADCLNEMGAGWVTKQKWDAVLLPGFEFDEIKGCIDSKQIGIKLDGKNREILNYRLYELKKKLEQEFELRKIGEVKWERMRDDFLRRIDEIAGAGQGEKEEEILEKIGHGTLLLCKSGDVRGVDSDYIRCIDKKAENDYLVEFNSRPFGKEKEYPEFLSVVYKYMDYVNLWEYVENHTDARFCAELINQTDSLKMIQMEFKHSGTEIFHKKEIWLQPGRNEIKIYFSECRYKVLEKVSEICFVIKPASYKDDKGVIEIKDVRVE